MPHSHLGGVSIDSLVQLPEEQRCVALSELLQSFPHALSAAATALGLTPLTQSECRQAMEDFSQIPLTEALAQRVLPLRLNDQPLVALADPFSLPLRQWALRFNALPVLTSLTWLNARLDALGKEQRTLDQLEQQSEENTENGCLEITPAAIASEPHAVIKLVNATLYDALQSRASDIHLSAVADGLMVKYRIDGVLHNIRHCAGL